MLSNLARELGCRIRKESTNTSSGPAAEGESIMHFADLTVPLKFPERRKTKK